MVADENSVGVNQIVIERKFSAGNGEGLEKSNGVFVRGMSEGQNALVNGWNSNGVVERDNVIGNVIVFGVDGVENGNFNGGSGCAV